MAERESDITITTDTAYLAVMGELWVYIVRILEKIDRVISALHGIVRLSNMPLSDNDSYHINTFITSTSK